MSAALYTGNEMSADRLMDCKYVMCIHKVYVKFLSVLEIMLAAFPIRTEIVVES